MGETTTTLPGGAGVATVHFTAQSQGGGFGQQGPAVHVRTKIGAPVAFTRTGDSFSNDASKDVTAAGNSTITADVPVNAPCGSDVYVAITAPGGGATLSSLNVTFDAAASCGEPDAGAPDAGSELDAGTGGTTKDLPSVGNNSTIDQPGFKGCGCSSPARTTTPPSSAAPSG